MDKKESLNFTLHIPEERISVVIGNKGKTKKEICKRCNVNIEIESKTGEILISSTSKNMDEFGALKARDIIHAISHGFSPERAFRILDEETLFQILDLRNFTSSSNSTSRIKGRIIGEKGRARKNLEELTNAFISIYGHIIALIGNYEETKLALDAITLLINGRSHKTVYEMLYQAKRKSKIEKLQLWEN
ncbi:MAG: RNA-binding protein [Thaumarchaeota archaeon]|nr:MAG: RNA-binding protein [Nitrososphaerota archaeon]TLX91905.1 MAG: RNA-binding protein [Nitrososphaerota archaeon]